jgi:AAA15 family ATPase/GTPase
MKNATSFLEIKNFKTIKHQRIDCSRVNVFIGEPNVGKSNILEALALFSFPNLIQDKSDYDFKNIIRSNTAADLFRDKNSSETIEVSIDSLFAKFHELTNSFYELQVGNIATYLHAEFHKELFSKNTHGAIINSAELAKTKYYHYQNPIDKFELSNRKFLSYPNGENIGQILFEQDEVWDFFQNILFKRNNHKLRYKAETGELIVFEENGKKVTDYSYKSIADTLKRLIFYYAAIESNKDSILIFEEPEVHSFPPYISMLGDKIARDKDNQYFITTHSPYMLNAIIENSEMNDCSVFVVDYKNHETIIKKLSMEQMQYMISNGLSSFFNLDKFLEEDAK